MNDGTTFYHSGEHQEQLEKDAARYRWFRKNIPCTLPWHGQWIDEEATPEELDAAIDAKMGAACQQSA